MVRLSKVGIAWHGIAPSIGNLLRQWRPPRLNTEVAYSDALAKYLRAALPEGSRIEREYRHEGTTCDVSIQYSGLMSNELVLIEVKRDLRRKSDYDRLVGQIAGLKPDNNSVMIVLVGDTDPTLRGRLEEQVRGYGDGMFHGPPDIIMVN